MKPRIGTYPVGSPHCGALYEADLRALSVRAKYLQAARAPPCGRTTTMAQDPTAGTFFLTASVRMIGKLSQSPPSISREDACNHVGIGEGSAELFGWT